jgi:NDP-sugar pyrophosphorylase family protein
MEHVVGLLERHGFTDITLTLQFLPDEVGDYFGDGGAGLLRYGEHRHLPPGAPVIGKIPDPKTASTISPRSLSPACWKRDAPSTGT